MRDICGSGSSDIVMKIFGKYSNNLETVNIQLIVINYMPVSEIFTKDDGFNEFCLLL